MPANSLNLRSLLEEKTVLLLGAGASANYGFPLWKDLRKEYLNLLDSGTKLGLHKGAEYWREQLSKNKEDTVDQIAAVASDDGLELFQRMTLETFFKYEFKDISLKKSGWVENFVNCYIELMELDAFNPAHLKFIFENIYVISLNYDRSFSIRFTPRIDDYINKRYPNTITREGTINGIRQNFRTIIQPHGSLGSIPGNNKLNNIHSDHNHFKCSSNIQTAYGAFPPNLNREIFRLNSIMPVGLMRFGLDRSPSYKNANNLLKSMKNIITIGISENGLRQSYLNIPSNSEVFCIGGEKVTNNCNFISDRAENVDWIC